MPNNNVEYQLKIPSQTENLELIRDFVSKVAQKVGFSDKDVGKIELACDEACTNVIKHAYNSKNGKNRLDVLVRVNFDKLTLVVTDHGKGFDPKAVQMPDMKEYLAELKVGGLGVYLIRTLMDEVDYDINPGVKNQVKMVKYFLDKESKVVNAEKENR